MEASDSAPAGGSATSRADPIAANVQRDRVGEGTDAAETAPILPWGLDQLQRPRTGLCFRLVVQSSRSLRLGVRVGSLARKPKTKIPMKKKTTE